METLHLDTKKVAAEFPDLETDRQREAVRRLWCLGPLASADADAKSLQQRAKQTWIPLKVLVDWRRGVDLCTAHAFDSPAGRAVTAREVGQAQRHQRGLARLQIQQARHALEAADKEVQVLASAPSISASAPASASPPTKEEADKANQGSVVSPQAVLADPAASALPSTKEGKNKESQVHEPSSSAPVVTQTPASTIRKKSAEHAPAHLPSTRPKRTTRAKTSPTPRQNVLDLLTQRRHAQDGGTRQ